MSEIEVPDLVGAVQEAVRELEAAHSSCLDAAAVGATIDDREFLEAVGGLKLQRRWIRQDAQNALTENAIDRPAKDPTEETKRSHVLAALRALAAKQRGEAIDAAIESGDLTTVRAIVTSSHWLSGLTQAQLAGYREKATAEFLQPVHRALQDAEQLLSEAMERLPDLQEQLETAVADLEREHAVSDYRRQLGLRV